MGGASDESTVRSAGSRRSGTGTTENASVVPPSAVPASLRLGRRTLLGGLTLLATTGCLGDGSPPPTNETNGDDGPAGTGPGRDGSDGSLGDHVDDHRSNHVENDGQVPPDGIEANLYGLTTAENVTAYAERYSYDIRDGAVLVDVELTEHGSFPADVPFDETRRGGSTVQGYVAIHDLRRLADAENVSFVRSPLQSTPDQTTENASRPR